ncbi:hypothetical protein NEIELOOT_01681 [Neisseria elongata subsp. glycolytica ATCC 29315]|uniref:Uncharacterized protein n=1 Tax=Neisseria elongata subsp. glycolytica ATCC 29315 TaxID=546263 RepID=D4DRI8_NEIEG|nr:hypothetical protein NEIELOOT_01681 [Neisseria elongata subsp. glycolytica ATCC 29315]
MSVICHGLVGGCFVANSNTNALYHHSRAGGNPEFGLSGIDRKGL